MKKSLLFLFALMVSVVVSAQKLSLDNIKITKEVSKTTLFKGARPMKSTKKLNANATPLTASVKPSTAQTKSSLPNFKKLAKKVVEQSDILGGYFCVGCNYGVKDESGEAPTYFESELTLLSDTIFTDDEGTYEVVRIEIGDYIDVLGEYDEETSRLYVPNYQICHYDSEYGYGAFALIGISGNKYMNPDEKLSFVYDAETDALYCEQDGYGIYMSDYSEKVGTDEFWSYNWQPALMPLNAMQQYDTAVNNSWETVPSYAAIGDFGESITVYNFLDLGGGVDMQINVADTTVVIPTHQLQLVAGDGNSSYNFYLEGVSLEGSGIKIDTSISAIYGVMCYYSIENGYIYKYSEETGANAIYFPEQYFCCPTSPLKYNWGWYYEPLVYFPQGFSAYESTGINNAIVDKKPVSNGVKVNLAGQRVGKDYKGIVIVNGKKVLK